MNVYVENIVTEAANLTAAELLPEYPANLLCDEVLSNGVLFAGNHTVISASWGLNYFTDSLAILDSNWTTGQLSVSSQGVTVFEQTITSRGKNTIIKLPGLYMIGSLTLELQSIAQLRIGILFVGKCIELPLFNTGFKYKLNVLGKGERTRYGIVYGLKQPSLKSFDVTFQDIENERRQVMEDYIDAVQFIRPHLVEPYETDEFPPVYATLADAGAFGKEKQPGFHWNSALSYMEAK